MKFYIGENRCARCGKKHNYIFEVNGKPYGSKCVKDILGIDIKAPMFLYEIVEKYIQRYEKEVYYDFNDFESNLWYGLDSIAENVKYPKNFIYYQNSFIINGKRITAAWQQELSEYIFCRVEEITGEKLDRHTGKSITCRS